MKLKFRIYCKKCGWEKQYATEAKALKDIPDSIPYCQQCGSPITTGIEASRNGDGKFLQQNKSS